MNAIIDQMKQSPVAFVEAIGWWPEPGYVPEWKRRAMAQMQQSAVLLHALRDIEKQIVSFLNGSQRIAWLENDVIRLYVRHSERILGNRGMHPVFDVASISVADEYRGQGVARQVFDFIELHVQRPIFVENVLSRSLRRMLKERGYKTCGMPGDMQAVPSMYII